MKTWVKKVEKEWAIPKHSPIQRNLKGGQVETQVPESKTKSPEHDMHPCLVPFMHVWQLEAQTKLKKNKGSASEGKWERSWRCKREQGRKRNVSKFRNRWRFGGSRIHLSTFLHQGLYQHGMKSIDRIILQSNFCIRVSILFWENCFFLKKIGLQKFEKGPRQVELKLNCPSEQPDVQVPF